MKPSNLVNGTVYVGKSGLRRRLNRFRICGVWGAEPDGDVYYTPIDRNGKEGKEMGCNAFNFANWAVGEDKSE